MTLDPPGSPTADPFEEGLLFEGLERAVEKARSKIPDHDNAPDVQFPLLPTQSFEPSKLEALTPAPFDSSAVMDVLRGAIDRYTNGDGHEQGAWVDEFAVAKDNVPAAGQARHLAAGYEPDRRRLAAVVVVLFLLVGGFGLTQFSGSDSNKVTTNPVPTVPGQPVTTATLPSTSGTPPTTAESTTAAPSPVGTVKPVTTTTVHHRTTTTAAPSPCVSANQAPAPAAVLPDATTTTTAPTTTTTAPTTTTTAPTSTTDTTPATDPATTDPCAAAN